MSGVFISYRRGRIASLAAGRLFDRLVDEFGDAEVFIDVDTIEPGEDFVDAIETAVAACDALVAVIGPDWVDASDATGRRRLEDPEDYVRVEICSALRRNVRVIPVLLEGAVMPRADQLPDDLHGLVRRQAVVLSNQRWVTDIGPLMAALRSQLAPQVAENGSAQDRAREAEREMVTRAEPTAGPPPEPNVEALPLDGAPSRRVLRLGTVAVVLVLLGAAVWTIAQGGEAAHDTPPDEAVPPTTGAAPAPTVTATTEATDALPGITVPEPNATTVTTTAVAEVGTHEAEDGLVDSPMSIEFDAEASNGAYVTSAVREAGAVTIGPFDVEGGEYVIEACGAARGARPTASDSMYVSVDEQPLLYVWDFFEDTSDKPVDWSCELVSARCDGRFDLHGCDPLVISLDKGAHTLVFSALEPDFGLDKVTLRTASFR